MGIDDEMISMLPNFLEKLPASWQAGFALLAQPILKKIGVEYEMERVYRELGVGRTSVYESARLLVKRVETPPGSLKEERKKNRDLLGQLNERKFYADVLLYRAQHPEAWVQGPERHQFSDDFKIFILNKKREYELDWPEISRSLGIPEETLKKFKRQASRDEGEGGGGIPSLPDHVADLLRRFFQNRHGKATAKQFTEEHPEILTELKLSYREFAQCLLRLGFVSPKGIFLSNSGLDQIKRFRPHCLWGTDGKQMNIIINGEVFRWVWQCLIEYKTTVLVGGLIAESETSENLLSAIKAAKGKTGVAPMAIVLDNRLSENLPSIRCYLDEMGIEIIKIFPGNSKSNGIIEGNFNIFERWVGGRVVINAESAEQLSFAIAQMLTEVFTQLRNHQPRKGLSQKTPAEVLNEAPSLSAEERASIRAQIAGLANRLRNEQAQPLIDERKRQALDQAIKTLKPENPEVFCKRLSSSIFTTELILEALAIFTDRTQTHPEKKYDHTYFGGILRNLADQRSLETLYTHLEQTYATHWAQMKKAMKEKGLTPEMPDQACRRLAKEFAEAKIPAHGWITLIHLQSVFMIAAQGCAEKARLLRESLAESILKWKIDSHQKRERLLRKFFECEAMVRSITLAV